MSWRRFDAMIAVSTALMVSAMDQLVYSADHATFGLTRLVSAGVVGAVMTAVMLGFLSPMYQRVPRTLVELAGAIFVGALLLEVDCSRQRIGDIVCIRGMISHRSTAINDARKARVADLRMLKIADSIIEAQVLEIEVRRRQVQALPEQDSSRGVESLPPRAEHVSLAMTSEINAAIR